MSGEDGVPVTRVELKRVSPSQWVANDARLAAAPFVLALEPGAARELFDAGVARRYPPGLPLFRDGEDATSLFFLLRGDVRLATQTTAEPIDFGVATSGEFVGEAELLGAEHRRAYGAFAVSEVQAIELPRAAVEAALSQNAGLRRLLSTTDEARRRAQREMSEFLGRW